jgi:hypothetical protein
MRFARPDLRPYLYDAVDSAMSPLVEEIQDAVLSDLPKGWTLVVNLGLVDTISAAFYRCLLYIRKCVQAQQGRLVLCGLTAWHQEVFELFRGPEVFTIVRSEAEACRDFWPLLSAPSSSPAATDGCKLASASTQSVVAVARR